jgi:hypothetical protein
LRSVKVGLHGCQCRNGVLVQRQVAQAWQLVPAGERPQARRVSRRGDGRVIRSGRKRIMGKCRRRRSSRVGRVRPRPLDVSNSSVVVVVAILVRMRSRHVVGRQAAAGVWSPVSVIRVVPGGVVGWGGQRLTLNLSSSLCQHRDVAATVEVVRCRR